MVSCMQALRKHICMDQARPVQHSQQNEVHCRVPQEQAVSACKAMRELVKVERTRHQLQLCNIHTVNQRAHAACASHLPLVDATDLENFVHHVQECIHRLNVNTRAHAAHSRKSEHHTSSRLTSAVQVRCSITCGGSVLSSSKTERKPVMLLMGVRRSWLATNQHRT